MHFLTIDIATISQFQCAELPSISWPVCRPVAILDTLLTAIGTGDSFIRMNAPRSKAVMNHIGRAEVESTSANVYWFSFGFYYYGSPASLVEQEVLSR